MKPGVRRYVVEELLEGREIADDDDLLLSGLVDSIGVMRLVAHVEQAYGVQVPPEDITIENFVSIAAIGAYLARRVAP